MPKIRGRDGKVRTVTQSQATRLLKSGYYQLVSEPAPKSQDLSLTNQDGGFGFSIYDEPFGNNPMRQGTSTPSLNKGYDVYEQDTAVGKTYNTGQWDDYDQFRGANEYQGPRDGVEGSFYQTYDLSAADQKIFDRYVANMNNNPGSFWDIEFSEADADGMFNVIAARPNGSAIGNMENDANESEWSDDLTARIDRALRAGPGGDADFSGMVDEGLWGQPGGGGGGSSGRQGPVYVSPDRKVVEDTVKAMLTSLTGDEPEEKIQEYADVFLAAHKNSWQIAQTGGELQDPNQAVLEKIRQQEDYIRIHTNRSETDSETRWISDRVGRLNQLGMDSVDADERGVWLAQAGTNLNDIDTGKAQISKGKDDIQLMGKIQKAASLVAGQL